MNLRSLGLDPSLLPDFEALLAKTPQLRSLFSDSPETPIDRALRRLSLIRLFNEGIYANVLLKNDPGLPPFENVIGHPDVAPVPRSPGNYWLADAAQSRLVAESAEHPAEEKEWSERFYGWLSAHGGTPSDLLDLRLRYDVPGGLELLEREYNPFDKEDDLVQCHSLAEQVEAALPRIPEDSKPAFLRFVTRYHARDLFLKELHLTAKYYPRPKIEKAFDELVSGDGKKWILYLDAPGGMGKTTFIQRVISHKLLKYPPFPLVVRADLDDFNVASLAQAPWLIAVEIARDLDQQLPLPLFSQGTDGFLQQVEKYRPLLYRRTSERAVAMTDEAFKNLRDSAREAFYLWSKFQSLCFSLPPDRPLLLFVDTIEEASLHFPNEFRKVLERFEELHAAIPGLRLVLSGRYQPSASHFAAYDRPLQNQTQFVTLDPLKPEDSAEFIEQLLGEKPEQPVLDLMVKAAAGNPFKLALMCELFSGPDPVTEQDIIDCGEDADVAYLIHRIINRIPVDQELGLRWMLRYGAVPRQLTFSFAKETLQPLLISALKGELQTQGLDVLSEKERKSWLQRADVDLDPVELWKKLTKYSSEHGWISQDSNDPNTVTLHAEVVKPMRRLLKRQGGPGAKIYATLNKAAADHFTQLKRDQPERWVDCTLGELFHRLESGEADPVKLVEDAFNERPAYTDAGLRIEVASEIVKEEGDFSDAPKAVRAWACYELADAIAIYGNFRYLPTDERRQKLSQLLAKACDLARDTRALLPGVVWRWREFLDSNYPDTRSAIIGLLGFRREERCRYWLLLIDLYGQERLRRGPIYFVRLLIYVWESLVKSSRIPRWVWKERFAAALIERGENPQAVYLLRRIFSLNSDSLGVQDRDRMRSRMIKALIHNLDLNQAERVLNDFPEGPELAHEKPTVTAELHLLRRDAWEALRCADLDPNPSDYRSSLIRGMACAQLLRVDDANSAFQEAMRLAKAIPNQAAIDRVQLEQLRFQFFEAEIPVTEPLLERRVETVGPAGKMQAELELCRAWQLRADNPTAARAIVDILSSESYSYLVRARALMAGLSWGLLPDESYGTLVSLLREIGSAGSRLALMAPPVQFGKPAKLGGWTRTSLDSLTNAGADTTGVNLAPLYRARFLRAIGRDGKAGVLFRRGEPYGSATPAQLAMSRQFQLADPHADDPARWDTLREEPGLYMAAMVECAERAAREENRDFLRAALDRCPKTAVLDRCLPEFARRRNNLEDELSGTAAARPAPAGIEPPSPSPVADPTRIRCMLMGADGNRLYAGLHGEAQARFVSTVESDALALLLGHSRERTPQRLVQLMARNPEQTVEELAIPFEESGILDPPGGDGTLCLMLATPQLVATPWELALWRRRNASVRFVSANQIAAFGRNVRTSYDFASIRAQLAAMRNTLRPESISMFAPDPETSSRAADIGRALRVSPSPVVGTADILCVVGSMVPGNNREALLAPGISARELARQIASVSESRLPFVILQVPNAHSYSYALEQVLIRNLFAQELVDCMVVSGVLATGMADLDAVMAAVRSANSLYEIAGVLMRGSAPAKDPLEELAAGGTALFLGPPPGAAA